MSIDVLGLSTPALIHRECIANAGTFLNRGYSDKRKRRDRGQNHKAKEVNQSEI